MRSCLANKGKHIQTHTLHIFVFLVGFFVFCTQYVVFLVCLHEKTGQTQAGDDTEKRLLCFSGTSMPTVLQHRKKSVSLQTIYGFLRIYLLLSLSMLGRCVSGVANCRYLPSVKGHCYTFQLKYVFRSEENVSPAMGQNSLTP